MRATGCRAITIVIISVVTIINSSAAQTFDCEGTISTCVTNITSCNASAPLPSSYNTTDISPGLYRCCQVEGLLHLCYKNETDCSSCYQQTDCQWEDGSCKSQPIVDNTTLVAEEPDCINQCTTTSTTTTTTTTPATSTRSTQESESTTSNNTTTAATKCSSDKPVSVDNRCEVCVWDALHSVNTIERYDNNGDTYVECRKVETIVVMVVIVMAVVAVIIAVLVLIIRCVKRKQMRKSKTDDIELKEVAPGSQLSSMKRKIFDKLGSLNRRRSTQKNDYRTGPGSESGRIEPSDDYSTLPGGNTAFAQPSTLSGVDEDTEDEYLDPIQSEQEEDYMNRETIEVITGDKNSTKNRGQQNGIHSAAGTSQKPAAGELGEYNDEETYENLETIRIVQQTSEEEPYVDMGPGPTPTHPKAASLHNQYVPKVANESLTAQLRKVVSAKQGTRPTTQEEPYSEVTIPSSLPYRPLRPEPTATVSGEPEYADKDQEIQQSDSDPEEIYQNY